MSRDEPGCGGKIDGAGLAGSSGAPVCREPSGKGIWAKTAGAAKLSLDSRHAHQEALHELSRQQLEAQFGCKGPTIGV